MKNCSGKILFLDRSDINTDEIIPARYLSEPDRNQLKNHCLEDLELTGFDPVRGLLGKHVIITRANFGCGSSREHAQWALEGNEIHLVIAENFARIFRQNMFDCGMLALSCGKETVDRLFREFSGAEAELELNLAEKYFTVSGSGKKIAVDFEISNFEQELVKAGGWVRYADANF